MFEYELQRIRSAELIREADNYRLARAAVRAAKREAGRSDHHDSEGQVHTRRQRRSRFARAA
ncbi:hypothetical protein [Streptomyces sp. NPDC050704]|uniref:hypothetical protein n=1 Tax=Streptomyces sp. NPDC050704 TaxID=3157219 RepID=UPI00343A8081